MNEFGGCVFLFCLAAGVGVYFAVKMLKVKAEAEFQQKHPELWRQKELLKLERERMENERQLAEERAKKEALDQKIGIGLTIGRICGWW